MKNVPSIIDGIKFMVNGKIKVSSIQVSEKFNKKHFHVLRDIESLECSDHFRKSNYGLSSYVTSQKKELPMVTMTRDGFMFLAMGFKGKEAALWKEDVISAFNKMEMYIVDEEHRRKEKMLATMKAPEMTDALLSCRTEQEKVTKSFHYSNEFDMINRIVLGVTAKKWRDHMEMDKKEDFRESLSLSQIEAVQNLQTANTVLIETGMDFQGRKKALDKMFNKKFAQKCLDEILKINA